MRVRAHRGGESSKPLVTVGIFAYNQHPFVGDAIGSVLESTFDDWELVVVDDGSSDATADAAHEALGPPSDPRARLLADGQNVGLANRINQVARSARGEWLAILGGDDAYLPEGLKRLVDGIDDTVDVVWGDLEVVDWRGSTKGYARPRDTWQGPTARRYVKPGCPGTDILRVNNFISGTSSLVRVRTVLEAGGYTPGCRNEDLDMWLRLGHDHLFRYVDEPVAKYRVVPGSGSRSEKAAVLDQAALARRLGEVGAYPPEGLARLVAMRWALALARSHGRPVLTLAEIAEVSGLTRGQILRQLPRAGLDPIALSLRAHLRGLGAK
jgi:glycosyltransferase involved in cell wall biosynthesis